MKKWLRRFAKLASGVLVLLVLSLIEESVRGRILLASYKHQLRVMGEKLTLAELGLTNAPAPPDTATVELLAAAKKLPDWNPDNRWEAQTLKFMRPVISGAATFSWQVPIGELRSINNNWVPNTWPVVIEQLHSNAPALSAAMNALQRNPRGVSYGFLKDPTFAHDLRDKLRYWLMWVTANSLRDGNLDGAGETALALARLGRTFQTAHPGYYRQFMQHGMDATWELLQSGATNDDQLSAMQDIWSKAAIVPDLAKINEGYRAWDVTRIEAQKWGAIDEHDVSAYSDPLELQLSSPTTVALWFLAGRYFDEYAVLVVSQDRLRCARAIARTRRWNSWQEPPWPKRLLWCLPWSRVIRFLYRYSEDWHFSEPMLRSFEFETQREMTVAAIALQRYRLRHGWWPEKLEDLVPEFLPALPCDWMDGQPLRYRRNANDTFTLYSVGEDLRDDGGDPSHVPVEGFDKSPQPMWTGRDAVWPCVATDENVAALKRGAAAMKVPHPADH